MISFMLALTLAAADPAIPPPVTPPAALPPSPLAACAPATTAQAMTCLDKYWSPTTRDTFTALQAKDVIGAHFGVGQWMRNNWGLWAGGPLNQFYTAQGVAHPDSMSTVILNAYWLKLQGCTLAWDDVAKVRAAFEAAQKGEVCAK